MKRFIFQAQICRSQVKFVGILIDIQFCTFKQPQYNLYNPIFREINQ